MDRMHSGWLTKSPPESRMRGPFKSHWRRRFFVLYGPPKSSSSVSLAASVKFTALHYYDSDKSTASKKGSIDLELCDEVNDRLHSNYYKHLFSLRTRDHGHDRTYYLAAESEEEMDDWVEHLARILNLSDTPINSVLSPTPSSVSSVSSSTNNFSRSASSVTQQHAQPNGDVKIASRSTVTSPLSAQPPTPLKNFQSTTISTLLPPPNAAPPPLSPKQRTPQDVTSTPYSYDHRTDHYAGNATTNAALISSDASDKLPIIAPKRRTQKERKQADEYHGRTDPYADDDDIYKYPVVKEELYDSPAVACKQDEIYDSPAGLALSGGYHDDTYDMPPRTHVNNDTDDSGDDPDMYDTPPVLAGNVLPPLAHGFGNSAGHDYVNSPAAVLAAQHEHERQHADPRLNDVDGDDDSIYKVMVTPRTRSFRSSTTRQQKKAASAAAEEAIRLPIKKPLTEDDLEDESDN